MTGAGALFGVALTAFVLGDATSLYPRTLDHAAFAVWIGRQWLKNRVDAYRWTNWIGGCGMVPVAVGLTLRLSGIHVSLSHVAVNVVIVVALTLCVADSFLGLNRTKHPPIGNDQKAVQMAEAIATVAAISFYSTLLLLVVP